MKRFILLLLLIYTTTVHALIDLDSDGLDDVWEYKYAATELRPNGDIDGDGISNLWESLAGTDPKDASSRFVITEIEKLEDAYLVYFNSQFGKKYRLLASNALDADDWKQHYLNKPGGEGREFIWIGFSQLNDMGLAFSPLFLRVGVSDSDSDGDLVNDWSEHKLSDIGFDPDNGQSASPDKDDYVSALEAIGLNEHISGALGHAHGKEYYGMALIWCYHHNVMTPSGKTVSGFGLCSLAECENLELPFVKMFPGENYWNYLQPERDRFDFSILDAQLSHANKIQKPIEINITISQQDGIPSWVYEEVPWVGGWSRGVRCPQFWHPKYVMYYKNLIEAVANRIKESPYRKWVHSVRIQPNAFNAEAWSWDFYDQEVIRAGATKDRSQWKILKDGAWIPAGDSIYEGILEEDEYAIGKAYVLDVAKTYNENFHPLGIATLVRPWIQEELGIDEQEMKEHIWVNEKVLCLGTEASSASYKYTQPRGLAYKANSRDRNQPSFYEDVKDTEHPQSRSILEWFPQGMAFSDAQDIYWRQIYKLHLGVTYSGTYMLDIVRWWQDGFAESYDFFNKYAGAYLDPADSPGAFYVLAKFENKWHDRVQEGVSYFINKTEGDYSVRKNVGNGDYRGMVVADLESTLRFSLDPDFAAACAGKDMKLMVSSIGKKGDKFQTSITSRGASVIKETTIEADDAFQTEEILLTDVNFDPSKAALELMPTLGKPSIHMIELTYDEAYPTIREILPPPADTTRKRQGQIVFWALNREMDRAKIKGQGLSVEYVPDEKTIGGQGCLKVTILNEDAVLYFAPDYEIKAGHTYYWEYYAKSESPITLNAIVTDDLSEPLSINTEKTFTINTSWERFGKMYLTQREASASRQAYVQFGPEDTGKTIYFSDFFFRSAD